MREKKIDIYKERYHLKHWEHITKRSALRAKHHRKGTTQAQDSRGDEHHTKPEAAGELGSVQVHWVQWLSPNGLRVEVSVRLSPPGSVSAAIVLATFQLNPLVIDGGVQWWKFRDMSWWIDWDSKCPMSSQYPRLVHLRLSSVCGSVLVRSLSIWTSHQHRTHIIVRSRLLRKPCSHYQLSPPILLQTCQA